jgi:hypothetical protein
MGIRAAHCGIGYGPELTRIAPAPEDIDVLFVGSVNERRLIVLKQLAERGVNVDARFNLYGPERDAFVARARIILNVHFYDARLFEMVRVSEMAYMTHRIYFASTPRLPSAPSRPQGVGG